MPKIVKSGIVYSSGSTVPAANIPYTPPSGSSSSATTAKAALDELITSVEGLQGTNKYTGTSNDWNDKGSMTYSVVYNKATLMTNVSVEIHITEHMTAGDQIRFNLGGTGNIEPIIDIERVVPVYMADGHTPTITEGDSVVISNAAGAIGWAKLKIVGDFDGRYINFYVDAYTDIGNSEATTPTTDNPYVIYADFAFNGKKHVYVS